MGTVRAKMVSLAHRVLLWTLPELRRAVDELVEDARPITGVLSA